MILLFTDYGGQGPYAGQLEVVLRMAAPTASVIHLCHDAPAGQPKASSYLLAALARQLPANSIIVAVVDPGVGSERHAAALEADGRWFVGPENGLLNTIAVQAQQCRWHQIHWRPNQLSATFHGRDLFAPIAARIAKRDFSWRGPDWSGPDLSGWPSDLAEIVYFDHYGNAYTGLRYDSAQLDMKLEVLRHRLHYAPTFSAVPEDSAFWYGNSIGLVEIAVNAGSARERLELRAGTPCRFSN